MFLPAIYFTVVEIVRIRVSTNITFEAKLTKELYVSQHANQVNSNARNMMTR